MNEPIATKTSAVSSLKIAVALAFLGGASLMAAAGVLRSNIKQNSNNTPPPVLKIEMPDLIVNKITLNAANSVYDGISDAELRVQYMNIGKAVVGNPFQVAVTTEPAGIFGDETGVSFGYANKASNEKGSDNKYNIVPGESAMMKIALKRNTSTNLATGNIRIKGYVDFVDSKPFGEVSELKETNNENNIVALAQLSNATPVSNPTVEGSNGSQQALPAVPAKADEKLFCDMSADGNLSACALRLTSVPGLPMSSWEKIFATYPCAGVYNGIPIINVNGKYNILQIDGSIVLSGSLGSCSLSSGGMVSTYAVAKNCIDELHNTLQTSPLYSKLYLNWQTCYNPKNFCSVLATDEPLTCEKRLKSMPELSAQADKILQKYACAGVYKGIPIVKAQNQYVPLQLDSGTLLSYSLGACTYADLGIATTMDIAEKCVDQLMQKNPLYIGTGECSK